MLMELQPLEGDNPEQSVMCVLPGTGAGIVAECGILGQSVALCGRVWHFGAGFNGPGMLVRK